MSFPRIAHSDTDIVSEEFVPWASFATMNYLLGHQDSVST